MSEKIFHRLLEYHVRESGYTNYEFARQAKINRVNLQRYLAGARLPDWQTFEALVRELRLGRQEKEELFEGYMRAADGESLYGMRQCVCAMLERAGNICGVDQEPEPQREALETEEQCREFPETKEPQREFPETGRPQREFTETGAGVRAEIVHGEIAVERYLLAAVTENLKKQEQTFVYAYIPAERTALARFVPAFQEADGSVLRRLRVIQLIRMTKRMDSPSGEYQNLQTVQNLLPAYYQAGSSYETWYYYHDHPAAEGNDGLLYPYYVILQDRLVRFSAEMDQALALPDPKIVGLYQEKFLNKLGSRAFSPLVRFFENAAELLEWLLEKDGGAESRCFLEYQPCIAEWVGPELAEQAACPDIPGRQELLRMIAGREKQLHEPAERIHYFTEEGLRKFVESGVCADYPPEYVRPLTAPERLQVLERMISGMEKWNGDFGIVNPERLRLTCMLNVFVSSASGACLVLYDENRGFRYLAIQEPTVTRAFETYIRGMREHREVYSREKTLEILRKCADWLAGGVCAERYIMSEWTLILYACRLALVQWA